MLSLFGGLRVPPGSFDFGAAVVVRHENAGLVHGACPLQLGSTKGTLTVCSCAPRGALGGDISVPGAGRRRVVLRTHGKPESELRPVAPPEERKQTGKKVETAAEASKPASLGARGVQAGCQRAVRMDGWKQMFSRRFRPGESHKEARAAQVSPSQLAELRFHRWWWCVCICRSAA